MKEIIVVMRRSGGEAHPVAAFTDEQRAKGYARRSATLYSEYWTERLDLDTGTGEIPS